MRPSDRPGPARSAHRAHRIVGGDRSIGPTVVVSATNVASVPDVGGHFWVFMQYAHALRSLGANIYWLERLNGPTDDVPRFLEVMNEFDLRDRVILYEVPASGEISFLNVGSDTARRTFRRADLLLNFDCKIAGEILQAFKRTAFVDIDPGLLQFWVCHGQLTLPRHDLYFTTGETVGTPEANFPDPAVPWIHIRPPVALDLWPVTRHAAASRFTTVTSWWGDEWITDGRLHYENNKRVTFLEYVDLPRRANQPLEIAAYLGPGDAADVASLIEHGWSVRHSRDVASTPAQYRSYIQASRGEFSCVKPSCLHFQNGWVSDRSICYLASGKPVVVQHTGSNQYLPEGEGLFRFRTMGEAADALETINGDYERHCEAARGIAEAYYDANTVLEQILERSLPAPIRRGIDRPLRERIERVIAESGRRVNAIHSIERECSAHSSWYASFIVTVRFAHGEPLRIFMKDFTSARALKGFIAQKREREVLTYRELLAGQGLGTATFYGAEWDERDGPLRMFLEYVPGTTVRYCEFPLWTEAARWLGRLHGTFAREPLQNEPFLEHHDAPFFISRAEAAVKAIYADSPDLGRRLERIVARYGEVVEWMISQPTTLVHGSFSPLQILSSPNGAHPRICPVDWERSAIGSAWYDLARLVDGFEPGRRTRLFDAYRDEAQTHGWTVPPEEELGRLIDCHRLDRVMNWLGAEWDRDPAVMPKLVDTAESIARTVLSGS